MSSSVNLVESAPAPGDTIMDADALAVRQNERARPTPGGLGLAPAGTSENLGILPGGVLAGMLASNG